MKSLLKRFEETPPSYWIALAFILRFIFSLKLGNGFYQTDESGFHAAASNLATFGVFGAGHQGLAGAPIPAFFLSIFFFLFGDHPLYARLGLTIPGTLLVWIVWRMTEELTQSKTAGKIALAIAAVYPFFIYYGSMMMSETLYLVFVTLGFWWFCKNLAEDGINRWRAVMAGAALALAGLSRPEGVLIMVGIWVFAGFFSRKSLRLLKSLALSFLCWVAILFSWSVRNRVETGSFALDSHGGISLLHGTLLFDFNEQDTQVAMQALRRSPLFAEASSLTAHEQDKLYWKTASDFMATHPVEILRQWERKSVNFWRFYPRTHKLYAETRLSQPNIGLRRKALVWISLLFEPWLILGGLWGLWRLRRQRLHMFYPVLLFIAATFFVHMVSVSQMRYRLPIMPFLILGFSSLLAEKFSSKNDSG
jgi:4-amino-4-deoxy-L-arabinose transferase-like glycosyltransferase